MLRGAGGCLAPLAWPQLTPGPISSSPGTARSPRSICSLTRCRDQDTAAAHTAATCRTADGVELIMIKRAYDYIVIGSGASGAIVAGELSKTGAEVLVVEAGGEDAGDTITNPSIWFYNVGGRLDWALPITPVPQPNNRRFHMALRRGG